jgi:hypothetical protein
MPSPRNTSASAARVINAAIDLAEQREQHLRGIIESEQTSPDEKFQALGGLARLTETLLHAMAEETSDRGANGDAVTCGPKVPVSIDSQKPITISMRMILLTCVACAKTLLVGDAPEEARNRYCTCSAPMIEIRHPGSVL